jgi:hypothetical protein
MMRLASSRSKPSTQEPLGTFKIQNITGTQAGSYFLQKHEPGTAQFSSSEMKSWAVGEVSMNAELWDPCIPLIGIKTKTLKSPQSDF